MHKEQYLRAIENMNAEYINLYYSKAYRRKRRNKKIKNLIHNLEFIKLYYLLSNLVIYRFIKYPKITKDIVLKKQKKSGKKGIRSNELLARQVGESVNQIKRYIRLTHLIPKILDMVDQEKLALTSAVEISFLTEEEQYELHAVMEIEQSIPNLSQANRLKRMSQQNLLDMDSIYEIMEEVKPNQREQVKIPLDRVGKYFPADYTPLQQIELIEKLLRGWAKQNKNISK